ncbi:hypothetical protein COV49_00785 [Candidatus Falkowbacteria bacterium CG11_big_fil_rev_8_21_14_0_20_39_10]|uniref:Glycosyltransferase RgtA/B/C/D-like domain-containing protein n=1 Tax=Candidatus Falkowbacteria bacterium CG11_big_fil_rev_8_21_14_0_20_39_10 TaxID=1974570 RepID=A0A2M6K9Z4_9BACT|nr:MAG: hypothetical protein COV49_00785 [Candidatus Falkowbacteria bacterium CG11_big_fil_rev_8_21_14_0_20_39_10]
MKIKLYQTILVILGLFILILFAYSRLKSIVYNAVPYTYDQGRDFYKAAEIIVHNDLTFIGPTTGIDGIFHGAWWYYYLIIPFMLFGGNPIGFYYSNTAVHLFSLIVLTLILYRYFNKFIALTIASLIAVSPYFISSSIFVGNNIMVLPALLLFLISHFFWIEKYPKSRKKQLILAAIMGGSLGLVAEFEFAFGLMILPLYLCIAFIHPFLRKHFLQIRHALFFLGALGLAFAPRILFELKNNFSQSRTLLSFIIEPKFFTPKPFQDVIFDRLNIISGYYRIIFPNEWTMQLMTAFLVLLLFIAIRKKTLKYSSSLFFYTLLVFGLYIFSTLYKDTFWLNYYEGFPYIYIMMMATILLATRNYIQKHFLLGIIPAIMFIFLGSVNLIRDLPKRPAAGGLSSISQVVDYIVTEEKNDTYCVKIYTPPAIPHTYKYLFFYKEYIGIKKQPASDWINGKCWIVLESDYYAERKESWIKDNVPTDANIEKQTRFYDIDVQLRRRNNETQTK